MPFPSGYRQSWCSANYSSFIWISKPFCETWKNKVEVSHQSNQTCFEEKLYQFFFWENSKKKSENKTKNEDRNLITEESVHTTNFINRWAGDDQKKKQRDVIQKLKPKQKQPFAQEKNNKCWK